MFILLIIPALYTMQVRAELYNEDGKVSNIVLPIFQYDYEDNMAACLKKAVKPGYYCK